MSASDLLESLNTLDETERIEAKLGSDVGRSLLETVCAFANEPGLGGGSILLGVARDDLSLFPSYSVAGVPDPDRLSAEIATQCRDTFNVPVRVSISAERLNGKPVLVVSVPEASSHEKPLFFKSIGLPKGAYRRVGSTDQRCTDDDVAVLYEGRRQETYDAGVVADASLADLSADAIAEYRRARSDVDKNAEELLWSDAELLAALGAIRRQSPAHEWQPTVAGLMLFGTRQALRRCFPMTRVDYIRVPGKEWVPDPEKRFDTVEMRDPLFALIRRAQAAVRDDLPLSFGLAEGELQRTDTPIIPLRVIREAIVNAVMHRNYRIHGSVQIIRYANRLEIRNPGFSLKSPDHLGEPGSQPRNPVIAAVLHETRFAETKGSGIRVMREMMDRAGLTPPVFESDRGRDVFVVARYLFHHFLGASDVAWLGQFRDLHLSDDEAKALIFVREAGAIDNASYRELNRVDTITSSQALRRLRDSGLLIRQGKGSATYYLPGPRLQSVTQADDGINDGDVNASKDNASSASERLPREFNGLPREFDGLPRQFDTLPRESDGLPTEFDTLPREFNSSPAAVTAAGDAAARASVSVPLVDEHAELTMRSALLAQLPEALSARVRQIGERINPQTMNALIADLLALQAWQADDLGILLNRNAEYLRQTFL